MTDGFDINRIDEVIHGRVRLGIMAVLSGVESADFNTLKARLQATDGNLSVHLRKLEEAGFVAVTKRFEGRKPLTEAAMTPVGRKAFVAYLDAMQGLVGKGRDGGTVVGIGRVG
jgi:DNA-binding HxlR family transcriptional regulator